MSGLVIDVKRDMADPEVFIQNALKGGFKYVKDYPELNKIHLDIREIL